MIWRIIVCVLGGYALGNLNGALITSHLLHNEDVREKGSGNAGLTNFFRNYGGAETLIVLVTDIGKAILACCLGLWLFRGFDPAFVHSAEMIGGTSAIVGHIFPVMWSLRGGKGILSCGGIALFFGLVHGSWWMFLICLAVFLTALLLTKYVSLGSILAAATYPIVFWIFLPGQTIVHILALFLGALAIFMHRGNIQRLVKGTERKLVLKKKK